MAQVSFITVGTLKEAYLRDAVAEYKKRLSQYARVEEINIKEETIKNEDDRTEIARALDAEGEKILTAARDCYLIALCVEGKSPDSEELSAIIGRAIDISGRLAFVIGSSHGLSPAVKEKAAYRLSVSRLTFPHQLMRPLLYEAVYRSFTILNGKRYHK